MKIIDVHAHVGKWHTWHVPSRQWTLEQQLCGIDRLMDRLEYECCIVSSLRALKQDITEGNREVLTAVESRDRIHGYVVASPHYVEQSIAEIDKYATHPKFLGIKNHPVITRERVNTRRNLEILDHVRRKGYRLPVLLHTYDVADCRSVIDAAERFPDQVFIMGHMCGPEWRRCVDLLADAADACANVYVEPASCSHPVAGKIRYARDKLGTGRILFGTDMDLINPAFGLGMILGADISDEDRRMILHDNAVALFGLGE